MKVIDAAPAKVNLVLQVGPRRADGLHELCSLFASVELADDVAVETADGDEVVCTEVTGPNLATTAIDLFREEVNSLPPLRVTITKRIPVAAGLGGGSADAAAVLRAANEISGRPLSVARLRELGARVGADVPSQVEPRHAVVGGAGERVEPVELTEMALVLVPATEGLSTAAVYAEADRIQSTRPHLDEQAVRRLARAPLAALARGMENDLEAAALSLRPQLARTLAQLEEAGALAARISGSGPTAFGVFASEAEADTAAEQLERVLVTRLRSVER